MSEITIKLPDGSERKYEAGVTFWEIAQSIGPGLARASLAVKADGVMKDMTETVSEDTSLEIITAKSEEGLGIIRHSCAHVLAMAVQKIWPKSQVTIGPIIDNGFYYDFSFPQDVKLSDKDLQKIEKEMKAIVKAGLEIKREEVTRDEAVGMFEKMGESYKVELIKDFAEDEKISIYRMGDWFDLCRGPHVPATSKVGAFRLTTIAGAYWRGNENNEQLTRIYGTAWATKNELKEHLHNLEEAKKRDHRLLGKQLDLFSFHKEAPANAFFHPKGTVLLNRMMAYMRKSNTRFGIDEAVTPLIMDVDIWHKSGHYDNYRENMYFTMVDERESAVKPMNCPGHLLIYNSTRHSYRDLPIRMGEFGRVHRHERSGAVHGLFRVRTFVQDDAHTFCTPEQVEDEVKLILDQVEKTYKDFGFKDFKMELSTRPEKSIGSSEMWEKAEATLKNVLESTGREYTLNPGDGAFYGPKIDFHLIDSLKRPWQCGTCQLDFSMPARFDMSYQGKNDTPERVVMLHRAIFGSLDRFLGVFIEHYAGHFPLWASPVQVKVLNITDAQLDYSKAVFAELKEAGVRVEIDTRSEKLGYKIREAQLEKVPYMVVIGDKEVEANTVSPRFWDATQSEPMSVGDFVSKIKDECGEMWNI